MNTDHSKEKAFQHFIITRFNLKDRKAQSPFNSASSKKWMEERLRIFESYCYASVKGQDNQDFIWLVFFDSTTEGKHREVVDGFSQKYKNFVPVYADGMGSFLATLKMEIAERTSSEYIITSRLDNDDCLHENYVDAVQNQFDAQEFIAVNFINGITLDISDKVKCGYRINASNPFISLIESNNDIDTIYSRPHGQWNKIRLVKDVNNREPLWLALIHGENIINQYIGFGLVDKPVLKKFNIVSTVLESLFSDMVENKKLPSLKNKCLAHLHYFLKKSRNKLRGMLALIPER